MATFNLGVDTWCRTELVTTRLERGKDRAINRLCRRFSTPKGRLRFHPTFGIDPTSFVGLELGDDRTRRIVNEFTAEAEAEQTILADSVRITATETVVRNVSALQIHVVCRSVYGPLAFVTTINSVTLELLGVQEVS